MRRGDLLRALESGALLDRLTPVYGKDAPSAAYRLRELALEFQETFPCDDDAETLLFSTPGRTELGGNHTDHQHGHGLAASVNLDTIACVVPNGQPDHPCQVPPPPDGGGGLGRAQPPSGGDGELRVPGPGGGSPNQPAGLPGGGL